MIDVLTPMIKDFLPFAQQKMGFSEPPKLFLRSDAQNATNPLGRTAHYDPQNKSVTIYISDRHPKDVMRSLSHELVHHAQNCAGKFSNVAEMGEGYAQNDEHLREMEREAYEMGNMCFRDWEDGIKSTIYFEHLQKGDNRSMSTKDWKNKEISTLLSEAWGFKFNSLQEFDEFNGTGEIQQEVSIEDEGAPEDETKGDAGDSWEKDGLKEEDAEEEAESEDLDDPLSEDKWSGAKKGDKGKDKDDPEARDYTDGGDRKGDESKTHKGEKDDTTKKGDELKHSGKGRGEKKGDKAFVNEDSGAEEGEHYERNEMSDEDHIKAIEHHLDALRHDRDYDDDHIDEIAAKRQGNEDRDVGRDRFKADRVHEDSYPGKRDMEQHKSDLSEARLREIIRMALKEKKTHG